MCKWEKYYVCLKIKWKLFHCNVLEIVASWRYVLGDIIVIWNAFCVCVCAHALPFDKGMWHWYFKALPIQLPVSVLPVRIHTHTHKETWIMVVLRSFSYTCVSTHKDIQETHLAFPSAWDYCTGHAWVFSHTHTHTQYTNNSDVKVN